MADPKTDINESLCCIALGFIREYPNKGPESFENMIMSDPDDSRWNRCINDVQITTKSRQKYKDTYSTTGKGGKIEIKKDWIYGSYFSAKKIQDVLKVNLKNYIISRVEKSQDSQSYQIKEVAASAIKEWAKVYANSDKTWSPGLLSNLNADKINISDIMLIRKKSGIYKSLKEQISITLTTKWKDVDKNSSLLRKLLTPKLYREIINNAWKNGEIYGISLKKVDIKVDKEGNYSNPTIPAKIINLDANASANANNYQDEVAFLIASLVSAAKNAKGFTQFKETIKDTIELEPVEFLSKDRLDVKYKFKVPTALNSSTKKSYNYTCWTNFGGGTNSVYFQEEGSGSASGEGGITLSYFHTLVKEIPALKKFIRHVSGKRKEYFIKACKNHGISFNDINSKMGSSALTSGLYNNILYRSIDFKQLVHVLLTGAEVSKQSDIIFPQVIKNIKNRIELNYTTTTKVNDKDVIRKGKVSLFDMKSVDCLEEFFTTYVDFLSENNSQMGKYFGEASIYTQKVKNQNEKIKKLKDERFNSLVLDERINKMMEQQEKLHKRERDKRVTTKKGDLSPTNAKKSATEDPKKFNLWLTEQLKDQFKLADNIIKQFKKEAQEFANKSKKDIEVEYKKSFALLANAEFGYMYSNHAEEITELVKKQVLLSLYAAASGRGYIIFNGKKFEIDKGYFEKDVQGSPFLKIGK